MVRLMIYLLLVTMRIYEGRWKPIQQTEARDKHQRRISLSAVLKLKQECKKELTCLKVETKEKRKKLCTYTQQLFLENKNKDNENMRRGCFWNPRVCYFIIENNKLNKIECDLVKVVIFRWKMCHKATNVADSCFHRVKDFSCGHHQENPYLAEF